MINNVIEIAESSLIDIITHDSRINNMLESDPIWKSNNYRQEPSSSRHTSWNDLLTSSSIPATLKERLTHLSPSNASTTNLHIEVKSSYVLYLPTVNLRSVQNPAYAMACHVANHLDLPLLILCTVLCDDSFLSSYSTTTATEPLSSSCPTILSTARRLVFQLEAMTDVACQWQQIDGATVFVYLPPQTSSESNSNKRGGSRKKEYLTMAVRAAAVIFDEPFVNPYLTYVESVEKACRRTNSILTARVDGSTLAPPSLSPKFPNKAWRWNRQTESIRERHLQSATFTKSFDAPSLTHQKNNEVDCHIATFLPSSWKQNDDTESNDVCSCWNLAQLKKCSTEEKGGWWKWIKENYELYGIDIKVPPCSQTVGTHSAGMARWKSWIQKGGLTKYAKLRNDIRLVHSPSRMSCYLNLGIVSIFAIIQQVYNHPASGKPKFLDEIIKWREYAYAHAFNYPENYNLSTCLPTFAIQHYNNQISNNRGHNNAIYSHWNEQQLLSGNSSDVKWDAMQQYLIKTGELHNNARMTWGKTVVHWAAMENIPLSNVVYMLNCLNDRFALDGISPPSYTGLLWCLGLGADLKQLSRKKLAYQYKYSPQDFKQAQYTLLQQQHSSTTFVSNDSTCSRNNTHNKKSATIISEGKITKNPLETSKTSQSTVIVCINDENTPSENGKESKNDKVKNGKHVSTHSIVSGYLSPRKKTKTIDNYFFVQKPS